MKRCRRCREVRPLGLLLEVTHTRTGVVSYVCRPSVADPRCARSLLPFTEEHVRLAQPDGGEGAASAGGRGEA